MNHCVTTIATGKAGQGQKVHALSHIAIIADDARQRHALMDVGQSCGIEIVSCMASRQLGQLQLQHAPDLWLIDVDNEEVVLSAIGYEQPFLLGLPSAPPFTDKKSYQRWKMAMTRKLLQVLQAGGHVLPSASNQPLLPDIWRVILLAGSMGGLEAVKLFLDHIPADMPVTFLLSQHIDPKMQCHLPRILGRHNQWQFCLVEQDIAQLQCGHVYIIPVLQQVDFTPDGQLQVQRKRWSACYQPSISDMMVRASQTFRHKLLTTVFSGMGNDGSNSALHHVRQGATIWAQTAESCTCASQPDHMRATGQVSLNADPVGLAHALIQEYTQQRETIA